MAFVAFAFVGTVSPGPNNTLLWASGMRFGFRRTLPHVVGTAIGMGALVVGVAAGIGAILDAAPAAETTLKVVGSVYLLYVAYLVLRSGRVGASDISRPLTLWQGLAFQWVNPKAWVFIDRRGRSVPPADAPPARGCGVALRHPDGDRHRIGVGVGGGRCGARSDRRGRTDASRDQRRARRRCSWPRSR